MVSFRDAAKVKVPPNDPVDMATLAQQMKLSRPVSLRTLITDLNASPPDSVIFNSGQLGPSTTTGQALVGFTIAGGVSYQGSVHESGFIGHTYTFAMAVYNYRDASGKVFVFLKNGTIGGTVDAFDSRDDSWSESNFDPLIPKQWDSIKKSGWYANLYVDTDAGQVLELVADVVLVAVSAVVAVYLGSPDASCTTGMDEEGNPMLQCTRGEN